MLWGGIDPGEQQRETDRSQDIGRDREGIALKPIFGLPFAVIATGIIVMMGGASVLMCSRRSPGRSLAFVNFATVPRNCATEITAPTISPASAAENTIDLKTGICRQ